jgi:alkylation response protein AidB-like acyl-CoA dehydrogenase
MDLQTSADFKAFREEARTWLAENVPTEQRPPYGPQMREYDMDWQKRQFTGGWAGIDWEPEYGGRGLSLLQQVIWYEECVRAKAPGQGVFGTALNHAGPTLIMCGSEEQKQFHLPKMLRGETPWCQGFSEPGAGSDLASLRTRAVVDGDDLVVTGSKIWTWRVVRLRRVARPHRSRCAQTQRHHLGDCGHAVAWDRRAPDHER